ncbi:heme ABC transporter ATP-binding protein [Pedobacter sp. AW1-32]|uniref:heme ABC transporter ATP-binding protein n=1 Tax=Pedobacter sp. AW1-32 TaxID=3383026 RepID=UPI003FF02162
MLRVESVSYQVNKRFLLRDISFSAKAGEIIAILGANGAGKSTLMRIISGERKASSGRIMLDGEALENHPRRHLATRRAMLQQQNTLNIGFTVEEVVMMGRYGQYKNRPAESDETALNETLQICGLWDLKDRSILQLSGGEQQRVHLARTLAQVWNSSNALLLLDEPLNNMDLQFQHQTLAISKALAKKGFIIIMVLHDVNLAAQYANRLIMMKDGRKWWDGSPSEVLTPKHMYTAFSVHALVHTDPRSLKTVVVPQEIVLDASVFNSNIKAQLAESTPPSGECSQNEHLKIPSPTNKNESYGKTAEV